VLVSSDVYVESLSISSSVLNDDGEDDESNSVSLVDSNVVLEMSSVESTISTPSPSSSSSGHQSSPSSSSSIGLLVVSTGINSSSTHGCLLHSSFGNATESSPHNDAFVANFPSAMHSTFRVRFPPPHGLLQSLHGPVNHWPSHSLPVSHSLEFSGFSDASHLDSSSAGVTPFLSNFPHRTFLV